MHPYPACDQRNSESSRHSLQVFHCFSTPERGYWEAALQRWSIHVTRKLSHFNDVSPRQISNTLTSAVDISFAMLQISQISAQLIEDCNWISFQHEAPQLKILDF